MRKWTKEAGDGGNDEHHREHDQVTKAAYYQPRKVDQGSRRWWQ